MQSLNEDLKTGSFRQVYLLYGEEDYLKKLYKGRLKKAMTAEGDTMNFTYFEGKQTNPREVIDLAETMPFFAERRVIMLENTGFFKNAAPELAEYIKEMPDTSYLIFIESEVDKRNKLFKAVKSKGRPVELGRQDTQTLIKWILGNVRREGKQITSSTVQYLVQKVGSDMENLEKELEKLFCYTLEKDCIEISDVEEVCTSHIENQIFSMVDAVASKQQKKALNYYYDLLALKEPPMRILFLLARQFRILLEVKELTGKGYPGKEIAQKAGIPPFSVKKYLAQARVFSAGVLRAIMEAAAQTEEDIKTGRLTDVLAVELFLIEYSK
ncbi:MAG TPA: DNA polymerase III subunit delta [Lachnospiraceae bacterium]|nr:DNA polymerase III subunit delta [Lachnospiraceae bacterium]